MNQQRMNQNAERRRASRSESHSMAVYLSHRVMGGIIGGETTQVMEIRCSCGQIFGGKRFEDTYKITLSDILEMVRVHNSQLNS